LQLSSLVILMLDPYFRSMEGFIALIEKEWLSFGHRVCVASTHLGPRCDAIDDRETNRRSTMGPVNALTQFSDRSCFLTTDDSQAVQPFFLQFIDCVYQILRQAPCAFEFNANLLGAMSNHVFSGMRSLSLVPQHTHKAPSLTIGWSISKRTVRHVHLELGARATRDVVAALHQVILVACT